MDQVALDADRLLGGSPDTALVIDESGLPKKGKKSVGVARQWCERLGKVDNCQTGVYASLVHRAQATIIDCRLYLPKEWTDDRKRCKAAGVPDDIEFKSKSQLALDIIRHARSTGIRYSWVGVDTARNHSFSKPLTTRANSFLPMSIRISPFILKILGHTSLNDKLPKEDRLPCTRLISPGRRWQNGRPVNQKMPGNE